ncbi:MAG: lytic transglycosylase, partial [Chloroflexus aggregans]
MASKWLVRQRAVIWVCGLLGCWLVACTTPAFQPSSDPTATPTELPATSTPLPITAIELWQRAIAASTIGDDDSAAQLSSELLQLFPAAPEAPQARLLLARSYAKRGAWTSAAAVLRPLLSDPT